MRPFFKFSWGDLLTKRIVETSAIKDHQGQAERHDQTNDSNRQEIFALDRLSFQPGTLLVLAKPS